MTFKKMKQLSNSISKIGQTKNVICINEKKHLYLQTNSLSKASFFTKTNKRTISEFLSKKRKTITLRGWSFYNSIDELVNPKVEKWDCEIHKVNLIPGIKCPLCIRDERIKEARELFKD